MNSIESQPPAVNFVTVTTSNTRPVAVAPITLITIARRQTRAGVVPARRSRDQWTTIPLCDNVNDMNTPITYSWISRVRSASNAKIMIEETIAEHDDAVGEDQPVPAVHELPRHVAVARQDRRQPREVLVGRVRGQDQDRRREELHDVEADAAVVDRVRDLRGDRADVARDRPRDVHRQPRDPEEHRDRDDAHDRQRLGGVRRLRAPERRHAVRDRLDARERGRARGERLEHREEPDRGGDGRGVRDRLDGSRGRAAADALDTSRSRSSPGSTATNPYVGIANTRAGLARAAQVRERDEPDEARSTGAPCARWPPGTPTRSRRLRPRSRRRPSSCSRRAARPRRRARPTVPRFSLLTMYAPPPEGYARTVCRYEITTIAISAAIAVEIGRRPAP